MSTLYHVLGVPKGASHEQVKTAFRTLARRFHPDVNAGSAASEQRFKEVSRAYETLADPTARAAYDHALVCRAMEVRRRHRSFAATAAATFLLTCGTIGLALWWTQALRGPESPQAKVPDPAAPRAVATITQAKETGGAKSPTASLAAAQSRGGAWTTYRNARF